ncbi:MAG: hypothetical protein Q9159_001392 [Coniocarpon cinnabarinum]
MEVERLVEEEDAEDEKSEKGKKDFVKKYAVGGGGGDPSPVGGPDVFLESTRFNHLVRKIFQHVQNGEVNISVVPILENIASV